MLFLKESDILLSKKAFETLPNRMRLPNIITNHLLILKLLF